MHWDEILSRFKIKSREKARWTRFLMMRNVRAGNVARFFTVRGVLKFYAQAKMREGRIAQKQMKVYLCVPTLRRAK